MTEKKYIITEDYLDSLLLSTGYSKRQLPNLHKMLKPVGPLKNKKRDLIIHKAVTAYEIFDLIDLHYFGELK